MKLPDYLIAEYILDSDGSIMLNYHSLKNAGKHKKLNKNAQIKTHKGKGKDHFGHAHEKNLEPLDGQLRVIYVDWTDQAAGKRATEETLISIPYCASLPNGFIFVGELASKFISKGTSSKDSDFKQEDASIRVQNSGALRGGATAYHDKGQVFIYVTLTSAPVFGAAEEVTNAIIAAACDAIMALDTNKVLGVVGNIPEYPGIWAHTETDNPLKVGIAGGSAHFNQDNPTSKVISMGAINVAIDLTDQNAHILPCGLPDKPLIDLKTAGLVLASEDIQAELGKQLLKRLTPLHIVSL